MPRGMTTTSRTKKSHAKKHKQPKTVSKKAAKSYKAKADKPVSKAYGKSVMKTDPDKPGRKVGYATVTKTKLPDYNPKKRTTKTGRKSLKK